VAARQPHFLLTTHLERSVSFPAVWLQIAIGLYRCWGEGVWARFMVRMTSSWANA
jgi:hypothetical protein